MSKSVKRTKKIARKAKVQRPAGKAKASRTASQSQGAIRSGSKLDQIVTLLRRPAGATIAQMMTATGWQAHSVRGAISGALKKKLSLTVESEKTDGDRIYRIVAV